MKYLYLLWQDENDNYDTYDSMVVCAESEEMAVRILPSTCERFDSPHSSWCSSPTLVKVKRIGIAEEGLATGVVLSSYNAG